MPCILCGLKPPIENSHIFPKLVYRRLKKGSPLDSFRHSSMFARPVQDGWKAALLCEACEGEFSLLETWFANEIYDPFLRRNTTIFGYDGRLALFSASLHFRNLYFQLQENPQAAFPEARAILDDLRTMCIQNQPTHTRVFQYVAFVRPVTDARCWPPGINSYLRESVDSFVWQLHAESGAAHCISYVLFPQMVWMASTFDLQSAAERPELLDVNLIRPAGRIDSSTHSDILLQHVRKKVLERVHDIHRQYAGLTAEQRQTILDRIRADPAHEQSRAHETWQLDQELLNKSGS